MLRYWFKGSILFTQFSGFVHFHLFSIACHDDIKEMQLLRTVETESTAAQLQSFSANIVFSVNNLYTR